MAECRICGGEIPDHSRVCPSCLYNDAYNIEIREVETPMRMLLIMRGLLDEYLSYEDPTLRNAIFEKEYEKFREIFVTFECVRDVVMLSFGKKSDVVDAVITMEDLIYERVEQRKRCVKRFRRITFAIAILIVVLVTTLIFV